MIEKIGRANFREKRNNARAFCPPLFSTFHHFPIMADLEEISENP